MNFDDKYNTVDWEIKDGLTGQCAIDVKNIRYPFCIVWTPIPLLTWLFPFIGHMGICTSSGVVRDFAGPYMVGEDNMAFGKPVKYWMLDTKKVDGGTPVWDQSISEACDVYKGRVHNLILDNCHSMVALALNKMKYDNQKNWNMVRLAFGSLFFSHYVSWWAWIKTYLPFTIIVGTCLGIKYLNIQ